MAAPSAQRPATVLKFLTEQGIPHFHIAVGSAWYQIQRAVALSIINGAVTTIKKGINKDKTTITKEYILPWQEGPKQTLSDTVDRTDNRSAFVVQCLS